MGLGLFMSQVNWTQLTEAVVLIRSSAFSGSSWVLEVGHPPPCLAAPGGSASQGGKVPFRPVQRLWGPFPPHAVHPLGFALGERKPSTSHGECKPTPLGSLVRSLVVPVSHWLQICPRSLSGPDSRQVFCC